MPSRNPSAPSQRIAALERSNRNLAALLQSAPVPVMLLDAQSRVAGLSLPLLDLAPAAEAGAPLEAVVWTIDMAWLHGSVRRVLEGGEAEAHVVAAPALDARYDARVLPWEAAAGTGAAVALQPLDSQGGIIDQARCREAESGIHRLKHQLASSVALGRSVVRGSAETADSLEDYALHLEARLDSVFRVLATMVREPARRFTLRELIEQELDAQGAFAAGGVEPLAGPEVTLRPDVAQVMALLIQELVTNAFQHGALGSEDGGRLQVAWTMEGEGPGRRLRLEWTESGQPAPPRRQGFGTSVLDGMLSYQLDGKATRSFDADGLRIVLTVPLANLTGGADTLHGLF